jgi:hypothetical protein
MKFPCGSSIVPRILAEDLLGTRSRSRRHHDGGTSSFNPAVLGSGPHARVIDRGGMHLLLGRNLNWPRYLGGHRCCILTYCFRFLLRLSLVGVSGCMDYSPIISARK